jgi:hypothetical protein
MSRLPLCACGDCTDHPGIRRGLACAVGPGGVRRTPCLDFRRGEMLSTAAGSPVLLGEKAGATGVDTMILH